MLLHQKNHSNSETKPKDHKNNGKGDNPENFANMDENKRREASIKGGKSKSAHSGKNL